MRRLLMLVTATLVLLSACGGGDGGGGGDSRLATRVRSVAEATKDAGTARVAGELTVTALSSEQGAEPQKNTIAMDGVWNFAKGEGRQSLTIGPVATELIVTGGSLYTKSTAAKDPAKPWSRSPAQGGGRLGTTDPDQALRLLLGAENVEAAGEEEVRGDRTDKYTLTLDIAAAASRLPDGEREAFEKSLAGLKVKELPAELWVDDQDRMRRVRFTIENEAEQGRTEIVSTIETFEFGVDADIQPPPTDQIATGV